MAYIKCLAPVSSQVVARRSFADFVTRPLVPPLVDFCGSIMSSDSYMSSDDDKPLGKTNGHGRNRHVTSKIGNGKRGKDADSSMSEDDMPLVCVLFL